MSLQKISAHISLGMLLSVLVMGSAWSATGEVTSEATTTVKGRAPTMTNGDIKSNTTPIAVGSVLSLDKSVSANWKFDDLDGDAEEGTVYTWKDSNGAVLAEGTGTPAQSYTILKTDLGKAITLSVTPKTNSKTTDPSVGASVTAKQPLTVMSANTVISVAIGGYVNLSPQVGTDLTATLACAGDCGTNDYTYQWQIEGRDATTGIGNAIFTDISGATTNKYKPKKEDQKLKIKVVVKNKAAVTAKATQ